MVYQHTRINLATIVQAVTNELDPLLKAKCLTLTFQPPDIPTLIHGDELCLAQVVRNLLSNAIKFTLDGTEVHITLAATTLPPERGKTPQNPTSAIALTIIDQGIGFPPEEAEVIFDKFVQSSKSKNSAGGTGLGLAICKEIITAHHGYIHAENRPDGGAAFTVVLPLNYQSLEQEAA